MECVSGLEVVGSQCMWSIVLNLEMVLGLSQNISTDEVQQVILGSYTSRVRIDCILLHS